LRYWERGEKLRLGDFFTRSSEPAPAALGSPQILKAYKLSIAAGLAGNRVAGVPPANEGLHRDRQRLAEVSRDSLEEVAEEAGKIILGRRRTFDNIILLTHQRLTARLADDNLRAGRHPLLDEQDLDKAFNDIETRSDGETGQIVLCSCGHAASEHQRSLSGDSERCIADVVDGTRFRNCPCRGFKPRLEGTAT
jgi:hypothetical protein